MATTKGEGTAMTNATTSDQQLPTEPNSALRTLDQLVGTWSVSGSDGLTGTVTYEWLEGGHFLVQHVDLDSQGTRQRGVEYIGFDEASQTLKSHYFGSSGGILEYTYELQDDLLTIWFGDTSSLAKFEGQFSADGTTNRGHWSWPGGGYESNMTRVT